MNHTNKIKPKIKECSQFKPCPFCGTFSDWEYEDWNPDTKTGDDGSGWVSCATDNCTTIHYGSIDEAETHWNNRVENT